MPLTIPHAKEALSYAHIYATAAMARVNFHATFTEHDQFDYGIDGRFEGLKTRGTSQVPDGFPMLYQAKASQDWEFEGDTIRYDLSARAYNNIVDRAPRSARMILLLLCLPPQQEYWHQVDETETVIRHCCYWHWFEGDLIDNSSTKRVWIPKSQLFTPQALNNLLEFERIRILSL